MRQIAWTKLIAVFALAFLLNWLWENLHTPLYYHPDGEMINSLMLLQATLFDALFITLLGAVVLVIPYLRTRPWLASLIGVLAALAIEWQALSTGRWAYTEAMPIVPLLGTGLTPTIQLGLLSYVVYKLIGLERV